MGYQGGAMNLVLFYLQTIILVQIFQNDTSINYMMIVKIKKKLQPCLNPLAQFLISTHLHTMENNPLLKGSKTLLKNLKHLKIY